jgi:death on curing protein
LDQNGNRFGSARGTDCGAWWLKRRESRPLESALQRPQNKDHYGHDSTPAELAAAYTFGIVKNHPFVDGNKRTGFLAAYAFLGKNGLDFDPPVQDVVIVIESLAAGKMTEADLVAWFKQWIRGELEPALGELARDPAST